MRWNNITTAGVLVALVASIWIGALALAQNDAPPASPAPGTPGPAGTPVGGWQDWQTIELTDVLSGEKFSFADYFGQTVLIQPMATWCTDCRQQLQNIREAIESEDGGKIVVIAISIETSLDDQDLADYAKSEGFDWRFAVSSPDMLRALVKEFGRALAAPPSTPHFLLLPDGTFTDLETGK